MQFETLNKIFIKHIVIITIIIIVNILLSEI